VEINEIITMFLDWQDDKPLDHFTDLDNETIGNIFEKVHKAHEKHAALVSFSEERAEVCDCDDRKPHLDSGDGMIYCLNCTKDIKQT